MPRATVVKVARGGAAFLFPIEGGNGGSSLNFVLKIDEWIGASILGGKSMTRVSGTWRNGNLAMRWWQWCGLLSVLLIFMIPVAYGGSAQNSLVDRDQTALEQGQEIDAIIEFDQTEAVTLAATRRRQAALQYDNAAILAERVQSYRRQKDRLLAALSEKQITVQRDYSHLPMVFARLRSPVALSVLLRQPGVKAIHSNAELHLMLSESLPLIRQPKTFEQGGKGNDVTVAVLDTGVDYTNNAFGGCTAPGSACKVVYAQDFAPDDGVRDDNSGHGTNVAGIVLGVAPGARIAALDVFNNTDGLALASDIIAAINWIISYRMTYNIVAMNLSLGSNRYYSKCDSDWSATPILNAKNAGILAAIAAGNDGNKDSISSPACAPEAVSVGAVYDDFDLGQQSFSVICTDDSTKADQVACFSNSSEFLTMLAPGCSIAAAGISMCGTSQAAPHVAGAIAVLRAANPNEFLDDTIHRLTRNGIEVIDNLNSIRKPRIDLLAAYSAWLTVSKTGTGTGTVTSSPDGINCGTICSAIFPNDATVTLTAVPNSDSILSGWSGYGCYGTGYCTIKIKINSSQNFVTAEFMKSTGGGSQDLSWFIPTLFSITD